MQVLETAMIDVDSIAVLSQPLSATSALASARVTTLSPLYSACPAVAGTNFPSREMKTLPLAAAMWPTGFTASPACAAIGVATTPIKAIAAAILETLMDYLPLLRPHLKCP